MSKVEIRQYSEKAIAVFGDTKPFINELKELGGKFNGSLNFEDEKRPGWIYPKKSLDKVQELVTKINAGVVKGSEQPQKSSASIEKPSIDIKVFMALVSRVERLEQELKLLHNKMGMSSANTSKKEMVLEEEEVEDVKYDEELVNTPRLMKRK